MPPQPKFTRAEVIKEALDIVSQGGLEALTARNLGQKLGSSARPIFTLFENMEEVICEVRKAAMNYFENFESDDWHDIPIFKQVGMRMVMFGKKEPELYKLLFMQRNRNAETFDDIWVILGDSAKLCVDSVCKEYELNEKQAKTLFENVWIYTFGVGTLCATGMCDFSGNEISEMLTLSFNAIINLLKSGKEKDYV